MSEKSEQRVEAGLERIGKLLADQKREDYETLRERLREARDAFHETLSQRFSEAFNAHLASLPQETIEEKRALARHANAELRSLGLAVRCPKSGEPAVIHGNTGHNPVKGRFQIVLIGTGDERKCTSATVQLPKLELTAHPLRREPLAEYWAERVSKKTLTRDR